MQQISSLYIHFPFCRHLCNYCDFYKHKLESKNQVNSFELQLLEQIEHHKKFLNEQKAKLSDLRTLYIGGGTPSLWSMGGADFLKEYLLKEVGLRDDCEFTIEIDPGTWTDQEIKNWIAIGVNRFSIGIQTFDESFLKIMDREHTMEEAVELLSYMEKNNFNYSVDLMLGLPFSEGKRDINSEIKSLSQFNPKHFSVYILKTRKNYLYNDSLPDDEETSDEYIGACTYLEKLGYKQYEVSNFAKDGMESKHNLRYWNYESVACLGASATGLVVNDEVALRYKWKPKTIGVETESLAGTSLKIELIYMKLRSSGLLKFSDFEGENYSRFKELYAQWCKKDYIKVTSNESVYLSAKGFLLLDSLMDDIFRSLTI